MRKTIRTLSLMMVVLFALSILPGGKWLSSANATTPTNPETATLKFKWGGLYTDEVFAPYTPDSGFSFSPTNPAVNGFSLDFRHYYKGSNVAGYWAPSMYPFSFAIPVPPYSYSYGVPYLCTPTYFRTPGANTKTVTANAPVGAPFSGTVTHSGTVNAIKVDDIVWTFTKSNGPSVTTQTYPASTFDPGLAPNGSVWIGDTVPPLSNPNVSSTGSVLTINSALYQSMNPGDEIDILLVYFFDQYKSGWWDWEETIPYNKNADGTDRAVPQSGVNFHLRIKCVAP